MAVDPQYFENMLGSTDSELMFHLALSFGLEKDPINAMAKMVGFVEHTGKKYGVPESMWMTVGISDGKTLWCFRYASDGQAPTLYHSRSMEEMAKINPNIKGRLSDKARCVVSEPVGKYPSLWMEILQSSVMTLSEGNLDVKPFHPVSF